MIICSWNIEHCRPAKITRTKQELVEQEDTIEGRDRLSQIDDFANFDTFVEVVRHADIVFLYEAKSEQTAPKIAEMLTKLTTIEWAYFSTVTLDEVSICLFKTTKVSSVKLNTGATATIKVVAPGERLPPILIVTGINQEVLHLAPWHAYGPAKQMTSLVMPKITAALHETGTDLLFGDFNFERGNTSTSNSRPKRGRHLQETMAEGGMRTSTQSAFGPTNRSGPLDRTFANEKLQHSVHQLDPLDIPNHLHLTNHSPLFIFTGSDDEPNKKKDTLDAIKGYKG